MNSQPLCLFLTVDTECYPRSRQWRASGLREDLDRDIYGRTKEGEFGIRFQMDLLNAHELKAVFFVESLFASVAGFEPLHEIVAAIRQKGHDVQLHAHTEWLEHMPNSILPGRTGYNLSTFSEDEQTILIAQGIENLRRSGVQNVCAFRAGNYGANWDTLRALARNSICYDSSYNTAYLGSDCGMHTPDLLTQPRRLYGVHEVPISFFRDGLGRYRHAQLCACSIGEMQAALLGAWQEGWYSFVIVSHSFELIRRPKNAGRPPRPDRFVIRRFEELCRFLDKNRDKFRTTTFSEVAPEVMPHFGFTKPLRGAWYRAVWRLAEQLGRRFY